MYFKNKGESQVLLGAPEEQLDHVCSEVREDFWGGGWMGLALPRRHLRGGVSGREWPGRGHQDFKDNNKVDSGETGWKERTDSTTNGHVSKELNFGLMGTGGWSP